MRYLQPEIARTMQAAAGKRPLIDREPWKVLALAAGVSATLFGALGVTLGYLLGRVQ